MLTDQLFDFLAASPSCYHAVQALAKAAGAERLYAAVGTGRVDMTPGGKYFVTRNGSSLLSFRIRKVRPQAS